jgi:hypothetical protein
LRAIARTDADTQGRVCHGGLGVTAATVRRRTGVAKQSQQRVLSPKNAQPTAATQAIAKETEIQVGVPEAGSMKTAKYVIGPFTFVSISGNRREFGNR